MKTLILANLIIAIAPLAWAQQAPEAKLNTSIIVGTELNLKNQSTPLNPKINIKGFDKNSNSKMNVQKIKDMKSNQSLQGGVINGGGGNAVGGELLDFAEAQFPKTKIDPTSAKAYKDLVVPILENIRGKVPGLATDLEEIAKNKNWYLVTQKFSAQSCTDTTIVDNSAKIVACQMDKESIYLDKTWFTKLADEKNQAGLLVHEMIRGITLLDDPDKLNEKDLSKFDLEKAIRDLTRILFFQNDISAEDLQRFLADRLELMPSIKVNLWNRYLTAAQVHEVSQSLYAAMNETNFQARQILPKKKYFNEQCQISKADGDALVKNLEAVLQTSIANPIGISLPYDLTANFYMVNRYVSDLNLKKGDEVGYREVQLTLIEPLEELEYSSTMKQVDANTYQVPDCQKYQKMIDGLDLMMKYPLVR